MQKLQDLSTSGQAACDYRKVLAGQFRLLAERVDRGIPVGPEDLGRTAAAAALLERLEVADQVPAA